MTPNPQILRLADVETRCAVNRRTIYAWIARGIFPQPISLGPRSVGWLGHEIDAWIGERTRCSRAAQRPAGEDRGANR